MSNEFHRETALVLFSGEFGRTPIILTSGPPGRQHWPQCFSAIVKFRLQQDAAAAKPFYDKCAGSSLPSSVGSLVSSLGADIDAALGTSTTVPTAATSPEAAASTSSTSNG